jgi:hypothetical protein
MAAAVASEAALSWRQSDQDSFSRQGGGYFACYKESGTSFLTVNVQVGVCK